LDHGASADDSVVVWPVRPVRYRGQQRDYPGGFLQPATPKGAQHQRCAERSGGAAGAGGFADLPDHHWWPVTVAVRDITAGSVPDSHGDLDRLRAGAGHFPGTAGYSSTAILG